MLCWIFVFVVFLPSMLRDDIQIDVGLTVTYRSMVLCVEFLFLQFSCLLCAEIVFSYGRFIIV